MYRDGVFIGQEVNKTHRIMEDRRLGEHKGKGDKNKISKIKGGERSRDKE